MFFDMSIFYILQDEYIYVYIYIYICTYVYIHISEYIDLLELGTEKGGFTSNDLILKINELLYFA